MAPSRPAPSLVVRTPRHASRRLRPALANEIRRLAKKRDGADIALDVKCPANDPSHPLGVASDNASEWNSLLITARAERGPQWDVGTQRFMVDYGSHLYFDPTPLTVPEEPTPPPEDLPQPQDIPPHAQWQGDPRFAQYGGAPTLMNMPTPQRTSLRLQQHHQQQQAQTQTPLNGLPLGNGMSSPQYPYGLPNGRPQHFEPGQSFYDGGGHAHTPSVHPGMTNGMVGSPMVARQGLMTMGVGASVNMNMGNMNSIGMGVGVSPMGVAGSPMGMGGMDFAMSGHPMPDTPSPGMRTRTRSQQDAHAEIGW